MYTVFDYSKRQHQRSDIYLSMNVCICKETATGDSSRYWLGVTALSQTPSCGKADAQITRTWKGSVGPEVKTRYNGVGGHRSSLQVEMPFERATPLIQQVCVTGR